MTLETKVIVITGATSGIGLSLLERLLLETRLQFILRICILCRNVSKGEFVRSTLMLSHKTAVIELVKMDTGDVKSVLEASKKIREKYNHIDFLYLNAGILPITGLDISALISSEVMSRLRTGDRILLHDNPLNKFGIPTVFATNTLGHFILFQELLPLLQSKDSSCSSVIWTTSNNAVIGSFDMDDFTCTQGTMPYGSSKFIINGVSMAINKRLNGSGVYSSLAEPGLCVTGINGNFLPGWLWSVVIFLFTLLRIVLHHMTLSSFNGSEALVWLFKQNPKRLKKDHQYESAVNIFNQAYVRNAKLTIKMPEADKIYEKMVKISENVKTQVSMD